MSPADDVRKLRERLNKAATECANEHRNKWARIMIEAMCALAALVREQDQSAIAEPLGLDPDPRSGISYPADPSQPAAGIVAEIDALFAKPISYQIEYQSLLQRARDALADQDAAFRAGQEAMRERAAKCTESLSVLIDGGKGAVVHTCHIAIRALPIVEPDANPSSR